MKRHSKVAGKFNSREEDMWILQRSITALRRKKKAIQKSNKDIEREAEEEFMKTLLLMEATLKAENEVCSDSYMIQCCMVRATVKPREIVSCS
jgi:hypothetical protein